MNGGSRNAGWLVCRDDGGLVGGRILDTPTSIEQKPTYQSNVLLCIQNRFYLCFKCGVYELVEISNYYKLDLPVISTSYRAFIRSRHFSA